MASGAWALAGSCSASSRRQARVWSVAPFSWASAAASCEDAGAVVGQIGEIEQRRVELERAIALAELEVERDGLLVGPRALAAC